MISVRILSIIFLVVAFQDSPGFMGMPGGKPGAQAVPFGPLGSVNAKPWEHELQGGERLVGRFKRQYYPQVDFNGLNKREARWQQDKQVDFNGLNKREARWQQDKQVDFNGLNKREARWQQDKQVDFNGLNKREARWQQDKQVDFNGLYKREARMLEDDQMNGRFKRTPQDGYYPQYYPYYPNYYPVVPVGPYYKQSMG